MKGRDRIVYRRPDKVWVNKRLDATKASTRHRTQQQAVKTADKMLEAQGGGELIIKSVRGPIRSKDTVAPGHDPRSVRDREH